MRNLGACRSAALAAAVLLAPLAAGAQVTTTAPDKFDLQAILKVAAKAPPLPEPAGTVVRVKTAEELREAARAAEPGTTILLADGRYDIDRLPIRADRLALRGASGDREKVILDGGGRFGRVVEIRGAKDLLIADLTVANAGQYGIFFYGDSDVQRLKVYNVKFHNCWVRGLKGTHAERINDSYRRRHPPETVRKIRPANGQVRYCLFVNDRVNPHTRPYGGDYIGGMDMMWLKDWVIADNVFVNIRGRNGVGRGAIFIWVNSENVVAERNLIFHCDRGICYGNPSGEPPHMTGGIVRNNFIVAGDSQAIEICQTKNVLVANNTIYSADPKRVAVQFHRRNEGARCISNLLRGQLEAPEQVEKAHNLMGELSGFFVRPETGDLHLTGKAGDALGKGKPLKEVAEDFDGRKRKSPPDVGADEYSLPAKTPPTPAAPGG